MCMYTCLLSRESNIPWLSLESFISRRTLLTLNIHVCTYQQTQDNFLPQQDADTNTLYIVIIFLVGDCVTWMLNVIEFYLTIFPFVPIGPTFPFSPLPPFTPSRACTTTKFTIEAIYTCNGSKGLHTCSLILRAVPLVLLVQAFLDRLHLLDHQSHPGVEERGRRLIWQDIEPIMLFSNASIAPLFSA